MTSNRPGAREMRTEREEKPAASALFPRSRPSSVGTGSRRRRSGGGPGDGLCDGLGDGDGAGGDNFGLLRFEDDLAHEPPTALIEPDLEHIALVGADRRIRQLKTVRAADPVPVHALLLQ